MVPQLRLALENIEYAACKDCGTVTDTLRYQCVQKGHPSLESMVTITAGERAGNLLIRLKKVVETMEEDGELALEGAEILDTDDAILKLTVETPIGRLFRKNGQQRARWKHVGSALDHTTWIRGMAYVPGVNWNLWRGIAEIG